MTALPSLFDLSAQLRHVGDLLLDATDGTDPDREAVLREALDGITGDLAAKVDALAALDMELEMLQTNFAVAAERFEAKATAVGKRRERLRAYMTTCLAASGAQKVVGTRFTVALRQNPAHVEVLDETLVPAEYWREKVSRSVDKVAVRDAVKGGAVVPGAALVAGDVRLEVR